MNANNEPYARQGSGSTYPKRSHETERIVDQNGQLFDETAAAPIESDVPKTSKVCARCRHDLSLKEFHRKGSRHDSRCKSCVSVIKKNKYSKKRANTKRVREVLDLAVESLNILESPSGRQVDVEQVVTVLRSALEGSDE